VSQTADIAKLTSAADEAYEAFRVLELKLPVRDRIERTDKRFYVERRVQVTDYSHDHVAEEQ
jgi:hypothetical protein